MQRQAARTVIVQRANERLWAPSEEGDSSITVRDGSPLSVDQNREMGRELDTAASLRPTVSQKTDPIRDISYCRGVRHTGTQCVVIQ